LPFNNVYGGGQHEKACLTGTLFKGTDLIYQSEVERRFCIFFVDINTNKMVFLPKGFDTQCEGAS
jgi:hypothetical protein